MGFEVYIPVAALNQTGSYRSADGSPETFSTMVWVDCQPTQITGPLMPICGVVTGEATSNQLPVIIALNNKKAIWQDMPMPVG
jgi:hypothetical protein